MIALLVCLSLVAEGRIHGRVLDADGRPVAKARVLAGEVGHATLMYTSPERMMIATLGEAPGKKAQWSAERVTDGEGRFELTGLAAGEFSVLAADAKRGVKLASTTVSDANAAELELRLDPPAILEGTVTGLDFDPSWNVLELRAAVGSSNVTLSPEVTRAGGQWSFRSTALPALAAWRVVGTRIVAAQDYRATLFDVTTSAPAGVVTPCRIAFDGGYALTGTVVDPDGAPLADASVVAVSSSGPRRELGTITDARGNFRIGGLDRGTWSIEARRWSLRQLAGCGNGPLEFRATGQASLPSSAPLALRVERVRAAPRVGEPAPTFSVFALDGRPLALAQLRGKVVLLDFWATWCGMCRAELPHLDATYRALSAGGRFEVIGVSVDDDPELVRQFVASRGLAWPQTALGLPIKNEIALRYNVQSTPTTVLIDRDGTVAAFNLSGDELKKKIEELLARE